MILNKRLFSVSLIGLGLSGIMASLPNIAHAEMVLSVELSPTVCRFHPNYASLRQCRDRYPLTVNFFDFGTRGQCSNQIRLNLTPLQEKAITKIVPDPYMRQQLWQDYGVCSGQTGSNYFRTISNLYTRLNLPYELQNGNSYRVNRSRFIQQIATQNPGMPHSAIRLYCQSTPNQLATLTQVTICYNQTGNYTSCSTPRLSNCPRIFSMAGR